VKSIRLLGALALALAAAPAGAAAQGQAQAPPTAPKNWWLLDPAADRLPGTAAERAYRELLAGKKPGREVVVAIIDSGVDVGHEDLDDVLWKNPREIPGNGKDDDGNGYVDDVHGWNFIGGRDGRNVHHDTYEVTRLYARLRTRCDGARPKAPGGTAEECAQFPAVKAQFEEKRAETQEMLQQMRMIETALARFEAVLKQELRTDSLTPEKVAGLRSFNPQVAQAQGAFMELAAAGITPQMIRQQTRSLAEGAQYGFNPDYDPRAIVGDNPDDVTERHYGNADVKGPSSDHGTHVAGIVAAERGNGVGMDGIASGVRIMAIRAVPDGDERDKDVANAIRYAVDNGAHVINMSFGKGWSPHKKAVDDAVRYADSKGVLMVHAAGNDAKDLETEPNFPTRKYAGGGAPVHWLEVGASSWKAPDSLPASFSNYGRQQVDVFAPGVDIYSTYPDNKYENNQGTSMAAPVVSGLAALIMAYYPELPAREVRRIILESATRHPQRVVPPGAEEGTRPVPFAELSATGGVVNAYAALKMAEQAAGAKK